MRTQEIRIAQWEKLGLSKADSEFLALVQDSFNISISPEWETDATPEKEFDKAIAKQIRKQIKSGYVWSWCSVCVTVSNGGIPFDDEQSESAYLGCCSYASQNDFITGGYFVDMVRECYEALKQAEKQVA